MDLDHLPDEIKNIICQHTHGARSIYNLNREWRKELYYVPQHLNPPKN